MRMQLDSLLLVLAHCGHRKNINYICCYCGFSKQEGLAEFTGMEEFIECNLKIGIQIHVIESVNDPGQQNGVEGRRRYQWRPPQTQA